MRGAVRTEELATAQGGVDGPAYDVLVLGREQHPHPAPGTAALEGGVVRCHRTGCLVVELAAEGDRHRAADGALVGAVVEDEQRVVGEGLSHRASMRTPHKAPRAGAVAHLTPAAIRRVAPRGPRLTRSAARRGGSLS